MGNFDYMQWVRTALDHSKTHAAPYNDTSGVSANNVDLSIKVKFSNDQKRWRLLLVHHLTKWENGGNHNLFLVMIDKAGNVARGGWVAWGWEGQRPNEPSNPVQLDKPHPECPGNLSMGKTQHLNAKVMGMSRQSNDPSDEISNVRSDWPDDLPGNSVGHHSHIAVWQWTEGLVVVPPDPVEPPPVIEPPIVVPPTPGVVYPQVYTSKLYEDEWMRIDQTTTIKKGKLSKGKGK